MIKLVGKRVAVVPEAAKQTTSSGIIIPDSVHDNTIKGKVVAVGPGTLLDSGVIMPLTVEPGDTILFNKKSGYPINTSEVACIILNEDDILVIL